MNFKKVSGVALLTLLFAFFTTVAAFGQNATGGDGIGTAKFATDQSAGNFSANATTIPYFRSSFTDPTNGLTYPFTMVGTNPADGDATTTIPTVIIPFRFTFASSIDPTMCSMVLTR